MHCLYGGYNLHRFSDALGLVEIGIPCHVLYSVEYDTCSFE